MFFSPLLLIFILTRIASIGTTPTPGAVQSVLQGWKPDSTVRDFPPFSREDLPLLHPEATPTDVKNKWTESKAKISTTFSKLLEIFEEEGKELSKEEKEKKVAKEYKNDVELNELRYDLQQVDAEMRGWLSFYGIGSGRRFDPEGRRRLSSRQKSMFALELHGISDKLLDDKHKHDRQEVIKEELQNYKDHYDHALAFKKEFQRSKYNEFVLHTIAGRASQAIPFLSSRNADLRKASNLRWEVGQGSQSMKEKGKGSHSMKEKGKGSHSMKEKGKGSRSVKERGESSRSASLKMMR